MDADHARFLGRHSAEGLGVIKLASRPECHRVGKTRRAIDAHRDSTLEIRSDEQREFGILLQTIQEHGSFIRLTLVQEWRLKRHRHCKRADVIFEDGVAEPQILGVVDIQELCPHPGHEELSHFFFDGEFAQSFLRPFLAVAVKMDGAGLLIFCASEGWENKQASYCNDSNTFEHRQKISREAQLAYRIAEGGCPYAIIVG